MVISPGRFPINGPIVGFGGCSSHILALSVADDGWRHPVSARGPIWSNLRSLRGSCTGHSWSPRFAMCFNAVETVSFGHSFVVC